MYAAFATSQCKCRPLWTAALGASLRKLKDRLLTVFEVMAYGSALLLLPCAVAGLFGCGLAYILIPIMLGAATGTVVLTGIAIHEGWYFDHLSGNDIAGERVEPSFASTPTMRTVSHPLKSPTGAGRPALVLKDQEKEAA